MVYGVCFTECALPAGTSVQLAVITDRMLPHASIYGLFDSADLDLPYMHQVLARCDHTVRVNASDCMPNIQRCVSMQLLK